MGKQVLTVDDVLKAVAAGDKIMPYSSIDCIITPGAMDKIEEYGLRFQDEPPASPQAACQATTPISEKQEKNIPTPDAQALTQKITNLVKQQLPANKQSRQEDITHLIQKIVQEKLASPAPVAAAASAVPADSNPVVTVHGNVAMINSRKVFAKAAQIDLPGKVAISDAIRCHPDSSHATTYMQWEKGSLDRLLEAPEINLVVEGELELSVDGKNLKGQAGDIFYMNKGASVSYHTPSSVKLACVNV